MVRLLSFCWFTGGHTIHSSVEIMIPSTGVETAKLCLQSSLITGACHYIRHQRTFCFPLVLYLAPFLCTFTNFYSFRLYFFLVSLFYAAIFSCRIRFMLHFAHVALYSRCTFPVSVFFCFAGFWRCTWFMLHSFMIHSFHLAFFLKFHSFHVSLASCCSLSLLHFSSRCILSLLGFFMLHIFPATCCTLSSCIFYAALFSSFTFAVLHCFRGVCFPSCTFLCFTFFMLQFLYNPCFSCCTLFVMLHFFHIALYHICTLFSSCVFFMLFPCYALLKLHFFMLLKIKSSKIRVLLNSPTTDPPTTDYYNVTILGYYDRFFIERN